MHRRKIFIKNLPLPDSSSDTKSGSAGAAIGGAVGGFLFIIIIIVLLLVSVLFLIKHSKHWKRYTISTGPPFCRPNEGNSLFSN